MSATVLNMPSRLEDVSKEELQELTQQSLKLSETLRELAGLYQEVQARKNALLERLAAGARIVA